MWIQVNNQQDLANSSSQEISNHNNLAELKAQ